MTKIFNNTTLYAITGSDDADIVRQRFDDYFRSKSIEINVFVNCVKKNDGSKVGYSFVDIPDPSQMKDVLLNKSHFQPYLLSQAFVSPMENIDMSLLSVSVNGSALMTPAQIKMLMFELNELFIKFHSSIDQGHLTIRKLHNDLFHVKFPSAIDGAFALLLLQKYILTIQGIRCILRICYMDKRNKPIYANAKRQKDELEKFPHPVSF